MKAKVHMFNLTLDSVHKMILNKMGLKGNQQLNQDDFYALKLNLSRSSISLKIDMTISKIETQYLWRSLHAEKKMTLLVHKKVKLKNLSKI